VRPNSCALCDGTGQVAYRDAPPTYTLIDADGMMLAADERKFETDIDERFSVAFWHLDGEFYSLLPNTYTVVRRGVEPLDAFHACDVPFDEDEE
jgi:hypothetical protein